MPAIPKKKPSAVPAVEPFSFDDIIFDKPGAAEFLCVDEETLYEWTRGRAQRSMKNPIPFTRAGGKFLRFSKVQLLQWLAANQVQA